VYCGCLRGDRHLGVEATDSFGHVPIRRKTNDGDLDDAIRSDPKSSGFQIEEDQRAIKGNGKRQWLSHTKDNNEAQTE
jgi:hypothetical protein